MRIVLIVLTFAVFSTANAPLINGSFEDSLGNPSTTAWVGSCDLMPSPGAPGFGNWGMLVPHSNAPGCGWSWLRQYVPAIADGETWTLSGWCANFTWMWADPYSGFRFGIKDAQGNLSFNTAALQNTGNWTHLSVTNSFTLAPGDTVFVECDPGSVSGLGTNPVFAMFDGVELVSLSTGVQETDGGMHLHLRPNPVIDRVWVAADEPILEVQVISADGAVRTAATFLAYGNNAEVNAAGLPAGAHVLWARTRNGVRTARFMKVQSF